jgi:hypothetical protein
LILKVHKNLNISGYNIKQKIEDHFAANKDALVNNHEERPNKSLPPPSSSSQPFA